MVKYAEVRSSEDRDLKGMVMECHLQEVSLKYIFLKIFLHLHFHEISETSPSNALVIASATKGGK